MSVITFMTFLVFQNNMVFNIILSVMINSYYMYIKMIPFYKSYGFDFFH